MDEHEHILIIIVLLSCYCRFAAIIDNAKDKKNKDVGEDDENEDSKGRF